MNDAKEGDSATVAGRLFQTGIVLGKRLLKQSVDVEYCRYL